MQGAADSRGKTGKRHLTGLRPGISPSLSAGPVSFEFMHEQPAPCEGPRRPGVYFPRSPSAAPLYAAASGCAPVTSHHSSSSTEDARSRAQGVAPIG